MDKKYLQLLTQLAHTIEILSEQVMELNKKNNDEKGVQTASIMRDDYKELYDRMRGKNFLPESLARRDFARFLVGAIIVTQQIENKIAAENKALSGYKIDLIPKLERMVNETTEGEQDEITALAAELFSIHEEQESSENKNEEK